MRFIAALLVILWPVFGFCEPESFYRDLWCPKLGGAPEVALSGRTRVDCLNATHAIEFDWGCKWAEAIGQALHYAMMTGKQPGVVLILRRPQDIVYVNRVGGISAHYNLPITVLWVEGD